MGKSWEQIEQEEELSREASDYFRKERWSQDVVPDGCPICKAAPAIGLFQLVTHLNDQHRLSFLDIAEVLEGVETISLDEHRRRMEQVMGGYTATIDTSNIMLSDGVTDCTEYVKEALNAGSPAKWKHGTLYVQWENGDWQKVGKLA